MTTQRHYYRIVELADALRVNPKTIRRWITDGQLKASRPGRDYLIPASEYDRLLVPVTPIGDAAQ